jgi:hypothetical protein
MKLLSEQQTKNLDTLATYLESLPDDYTHFDMGRYFDEPVDGLLKSAPTDHVLSGPTACGAVACAVGHGHAAGIPLSPKDTMLNDLGESFIYWDGYAYRNFTKKREDIYEWCFDGEWSGVDNTHQGAAKRIRYALEEGIPVDYQLILCGEIPYPWETNEQHAVRIGEHGDY